MSFDDEAVPLQRLCTPLRVSLLFMHIEQIDCVGFLCGTLLPGMLECCWTLKVYCVM